MQFTIMDNLASSVLGIMNNSLPNSLKYYDSAWHLYLAEGSSTLEFKVPKIKDGKIVDNLEIFKAGNHVKFTEDGEPHFFKMLKVTSNKTIITVVCIDITLELLNEDCDAYTPNQSNTIDRYFSVFGIAQGNVKIGINEVKGQTRNLSWDGRQTKLARLMSIVKQFDAEYEFKNILYPSGALRYIIVNIYKKNDGKKVQGVGKNRTDINLKIGQDINNISREEDMSSLFNAVEVTGKDGLKCKTVSRNEVDDSGREEFYIRYGESTAYAPFSANMFPANVANENTLGDRWIKRKFETDYTRQDDLVKYMFMQLRNFAYPLITISLDMAAGLNWVQYGLNIGDTIKITDMKYDKTGIIIQSRVSEIIKSFDNASTNTIVLTNFVELKSKISSSIRDMMNEMIEVKAIANDAKKNAITALISADGKNTNYYGNSSDGEPPNPKKGDIWFVKDGDKTIIKTWNGSSWVDLVSSDWQEIFEEKLTEELTKSKVELDAALAEKDAALAELDVKLAENVKILDQTKIDLDQNKIDVNAALLEKDEALKDLDEKIADELVVIDTSVKKARADANTATTRANDAVDKANASVTAVQANTQLITDVNTVANNAKTQAQTAVTNAQTALSNAQTALDKANGVSGKVTTIETNIDTINGTLSSKANTTDLNALKGSVSTAESSITQNSKDIALKANKTEVNTITDKVNAVESSITVQSGQITALNTKTDGQTTQIGSLQSSYSGLQSTVSSVQFNLDNLTVGGRNLLLDTSGTRSFSGNGDSWQIITRYNFVTNTMAGLNIPLDGDIYFTYDLKISGSNFSGSVKPRLGDSVWTLIDEYPVTKAETVSRKIPLKYIAGSGWGQNTFSDFRFDSIPSTVNIDILNVKFEIGNKPTEWSPAPEDMATVTSLSDFKQDVNGFKTTVANTYADKVSVASQINQSATAVTSNMQSWTNNKLTAYSTTQQTATSITNAVADKADKTQITQLSNQITSTVSQISNPTNLFSIKRMQSSSGYHPDYATFLLVRVPTDIGATYTASSDHPSQNLWFLPANNSSLEGETYRVYKDKSVTFTATNTFSYVAIRDTATQSQLSNETYHLKVERGTIITLWSPSEIDSVSKTQFTQSIDNINLRVVEKGDVVNQINISPESILIAGSKVQITGQTYIENGVIENAKIKDLSASKLTAGTIDASLINVTKINASNITTGTLNADRIGANSITATHISISSLSALSGNLGTLTAGVIDAAVVTVKNINASNITTGTLSADRIAANSITATHISISSLSALTGNLGLITAGTINAATVNIININAGSITTGVLNADRIGANSITADKIKATSIDLFSNDSYTNIQSDGMRLQSKAHIIFGPWIDIHGNRRSTQGVYIGGFGGGTKHVALTRSNGTTFLLRAEAGMDYGANQNVSIGSLNLYDNVHFWESARVHGNLINEGYVAFGGDIQESSIQYDKPAGTMNFRVPGGRSGSYFWFNQRAISEGSFDSRSKLSLKNVKGDYQGNAFDDIVNTNIVEYSYKNDPQRRQLSPIIDDINEIKKYHLPDIINDGESVSLYAMGSLSWLAIKQLAKKLENIEEKLDAIA